MSKIVIVCQSSGYLVVDIVKAYVGAGYEVVLMSSSKNGAKKLQFDKGDVRIEPIKAYDRSTQIRRIYTWLLATFQIVWKISWKYRSSQLLIVSNPPLAPLTPLFLRNPYSILIYDIWPDVLVNQKVLNEKHWFVRAWKWANRKTFGKAKYVFTIGKGMKECLCQYTNENKIQVVPLWADQAGIHRVEKKNNQFLKKYNLEGKFVVLYSGNMGNTHRVDSLVDVAQTVNDDEIVFVLIGHGEKKAQIERRVSEEKCKNVLVLPYQPYSFLSHSLSAADIAVVTLDTTASQMSVPSKTFNLMALGIPLLCIASPESELGKIVHDYEVGEIFLPEDVEGMKNYILKMKETNSLLDRYASNSYAASKHFTSKNAELFLK